MPALGSTRQDVQGAQARAMQQQNSAWPYWQQTPPIMFDHTVTRDKYANEMLVTRTEHDATLRFYRNTVAKNGKGTETLIAEVTVPLGVLDAFTKEGSP